MPHSPVCKWGHEKTRKGQCQECHRARSRAYEAVRRANGETSTDRKRRAKEQHEADAAARRARAAARLVAEGAAALPAIQAYRDEKAKRLGAGKRVLPTVEEWRAKVGWLTERLSHTRTAP